MTWCRPGDKPLSESIIVTLLANISAAVPQRVKTSFAMADNILKTLNLFSTECVQMHTVLWRCPKCFAQNVLTAHHSSMELIVLQTAPKTWETDCYSCHINQLTDFTCPPPFANGPDPDVSQLHATPKWVESIPVSTARMQSDNCTGMQWFVFIEIYLAHWDLIKMVATVQTTF